MLLVLSLVTFHQIKCRACSGESAVNSIKRKRDYGFSSYSGQAISYCCTRKRVARARLENRTGFQNEGSFQTTAIPKIASIVVESFMIIDRSGENIVTVMTRQTIAYAIILVRLATPRFSRQSRRGRPTNGQSSKRSYSEGQDRTRK